MVLTISVEHHYGAKQCCVNLNLGWKNVDGFDRMAAGIKLWFNYTAIKREQENAYIFEMNESIF